ncbi:hypothetical protein [Flagellimonas meridianipacifica]|uniref:Subunit length determinant protein n=1 Tax=Flagellimonas meridianipacifica TaxID=1080225 RepID=A0A2T0MHB3_9FLAO|nr:hypothetical protein [Allomuricauda pacifica]PRX56926.1 hypothetical protein CLV81_0927 [Allomuricauda pacifica]
MEEQPVNKNSSDEIDLGQVFQMIGNGFNKLGIAFLRLFLYLKKRAFIVGGLALLGLCIGYGLNQITEEKSKIEVLVKPILDSKNYLYDVVAEIENKIRAKDTIFFNDIGIKVEDLGHFKITIESIEGKNNKKEDLEYLKFLEKFQNNTQFSDVIRSEILKNSSLNHRIIFTFKNPSEGKVFAVKVMEYINSSDFFRDLTAINRENAIIRLKQNELLIKQIDSLIAEYTESIAGDKSSPAENRILLDNEKPMEITSLFQFKNSLIQNSAQKRIELQEQEEPINILNMGNPQRIVKPFFGRKLVLVPILFVAIFLVWELILIFDKKARALL